MTRTEEPLIRIVDDDPVLSEALSFMLSCEGWRVKCYACAEDFIADDMPSVPGALILDLSMPGMNGMELYETLRERHYEVPVIFLTAHGDIETAVTALRGGAYHFLQKSADHQALLSAVTEAVEKDRRARGGIPEAEKVREKLAALTEREREVVNLLAEGLLNKQIAQRLDLSVRTVEVHRASAYRRLGIKSVAELASLLAALQ